MRPEVGRRQIERGRRGGVPAGERQSIGVDGPECRAAKCVHERVIVGEARIGHGQHDREHQSNGHRCGNPEWPGARRCRSGPSRAVGGRGGIGPGRHGNAQPEERGDAQHRQRADPEHDDPGHGVQHVDGERLTESPAGDEDEVDSGHVERSDEHQADRQPDDTAPQAAGEDGVERGAQDHEADEAIDAAAGRSDGKAELVGAMGHEECAVAERLGHGDDPERGSHGGQGDVGGGTDGGGQYRHVRVRPGQ